MKRNTTALGREVTFDAPGEYVPGGIVADAEGNFWLSVFWTRRPKDVPEVQFIGCNPIVDSRTHLLYIPGQTGNGKNGPDDNYLLIYDCSGAKPVLKEKIQGKTSNIRYIFIN